MGYDVISPARNLTEPLFAGKKNPENAGTGLIFDRYLPMWQYSRQEGFKRSKELLPPMQDFVRHFNDLANKQELEHGNILRTIHRRQKRIKERFPGLREEEYTTVWRLSMGLGNDHPTDNGFSFDPLSGIPYIRASSIKGLCRRVAVLKNEETKDKGTPEECFTLFGSERPSDPDGKDPVQLGDIVFLDAYPTQWPILEVDIMNSHHMKYYQDGDQGSPVETESPNPVFFLTVAQGVEFAFRFFSRSDKASHIQKISDALKTGLTLLGLGGKTAVGYGRFRFTPSKSPADQWLYKSVSELKKEHNIPDDNTVIRGKGLAQK